MIKQCNTKVSGSSMVINTLAKARHSLHYTMIADFFQAACRAHSGERGWCDSAGEAAVRS